MKNKHVWFVTGAGRGMGVDIAKAALAAGHAVVATGRSAERVTSVLGTHDDLLVVKLDVTSIDDAKIAAQAAVDRFGRIDVLVNNAGNFYAGFFEEIAAEDVRAQIETTLFGPMNVTCAVLPVMRARRSGLVIEISSTAGIAGQVFCTAYAAAKFGVEGWIESLAPEVAPFGIRTMLVEPGFFRTELLSPGSTTFAEATIADYAKRTEETVTAHSSDSRAKTIHRSASWRDRMPSRPSRTRHTNFWPRRAHTATCPATSPSSAKRAARARRSSPALRCARR